LSLEPGERAPAAIADDLSGEPVELASLWRDGPALLFFYKGDCPTSPIAAQVLGRFTAVPGLRVAAVAQDEADLAESFASAHGWTARVTVLVDPSPWDASMAFALVTTPPCFLVKQGGELAARLPGWSRAEVNALAAQAAALVGASPITVSRDGDPGPAFKPG
jgi:peroxiredoxin